MSTITNAAPAGIIITAETMPKHDMPNWQLNRIIKLRHSEIERAIKESKIAIRALANVSADCGPQAEELIDEIETHLAVAAEALRMVTGKRYTPPSSTREAGEPVAPARVTVLPE